MKKIFAVAVFIIFLNSCGGGTIGDAQNFEPNEPPSILEVSALSVNGSPTDALKAGMKFTITVKARDPENKKLKFQFNSDYGYFGNPTETADTCTIPFVTGSFVRPGLPVTIDVSVIDHKDASAVTNYEIGKGRRGPTVTVKYIGSAYIQKEKNTQISFKADCEGIYQLYCDNSVDESSADLRPALAYFLYRKDEDGKFKDIIVDIKGPASSVSAKVEVTALESVNKVWVVFSDGINDPFAALAPVTVDNTPPEISSIDTGAPTGVGLRAPIRLVFDEDIMPSSVSDNSVKVEDGGSFFNLITPNPSGKCSVEGSVVTFVPDSLEYFSTYKVSAKSGIKDLAGNEYIGTTSGTFTTVEKGTTPNPVFDKVNDTYDSAQTVDFVGYDSGNTRIYYSTAIGSNSPGDPSTEYTGTPINAVVNTNIKAYAVSRGKKPSNPVERTIKIRTPKPSFIVSGSSYLEPNKYVFYSTITLTVDKGTLPSNAGTTNVYYSQERVLQSDPVEPVEPVMDPLNTILSMNLDINNWNQWSYRYKLKSKASNMEPSYIYSSPIYRLRSSNLIAEEKLVKDTNYIYSGSKEWKAVSCSSSGKYVAAIEGDPLGYIWVSDDYGVTWMKSSAGEKNWRSCYVSKVDPLGGNLQNDGKYMTATTNTNVCRSINYGENWNFPDGGLNIRNGVYFDTSKYWIAYDISNQIFGNSSKKITDSLLEAFNADGSIVFYLYSLNPLLKYWQNSISNDIEFVSVEPIDSWKDLAISGDGQTTAAIAVNGLTSILCKGNLTSIAQIPEAGGGNFSDIAVSYDGKYIAACVYDGRIYRNKIAGSFTGSGVYWFDDLSFDGNGKSWSGVAINGIGNEIFAVMNGGDIWCANYNGTSWNWSSQNIHTWTGLASSSDGKYIAACDGGAGAHGGYIYISKDGGVNWNLIKKDSKGNSMQKKWKSIDMSNDGLFIAAVSDDEYWFSQKSGSSWAKANIGQASSIHFTKVAVSGTSDSLNAKSVILTDSAMGYRFIRNSEGSACVGNGSNAWNGEYAFNDVKVSNDGMSFLLLSDNKIVKFNYSQDNSVLNGSNIFLQDYNFATNHWVKFAASDDLSKIYIARYNSAKSGYLIDLYTNFSNSGTVNESNPINATYFGQMESSADGNMLVAVNSHVNTDSFIYTSVNGGQNWEKQTNSGNVIYNCIASTADGLTIFAGGTKQTGITILK